MAYLIVAVRMVGNSEDWDDVMFCKKSHKGGNGWIVLKSVIRVKACSIQVTAFIISRQDPIKNVHSISFIVKCRLSGKYQNMGAAISPTNIVL